MADSMRYIITVLLFALLGTHALGKSVNQTTGLFTPRLADPRVQPIGKEGRTAEQEKMLAGRPDYNVFKTLAQDPQLFARWSPLGQYLLSGSTLPASDREIVILRMGWLCQAPYEWSQHARIAKSTAGMSDADVHRVAEASNAQGWTDFERTLIKMVDELRFDGQISDSTWSALRAKYSLQQTIDALYTAGQYQLVSMALNSLGVQLDPILDDRMPSDTPLPRLAARPRVALLAKPRVAALSIAEMSPDQRSLVAAQIRDGKLPNLYATLVVHPALYGPRMRFGSYLQRESQLPARARELLILRTAWLSNSEYEWAHHKLFAREAGLSDAEIARVAHAVIDKQWGEADHALLQATDELRREAFISDATWRTLTQNYDVQKMIEIIYTVGGYAMTAMAINSLGIQQEPQQ
jgi:4-carboxymuconolactone decarboxylase